MLKLGEKIKFPKGIAGAYNNIGVIHDYKGDYEKALEFFFKSLKINEEVDDKQVIASSYNNIGNIQYNKGDYDKALEFYFKSLKIREEIGSKKGMADSYNNIGYIYYSKSDFDKALEFYLKSLTIREKIGDKKGMADSYNNIGIIHDSKGDYNIALGFYFKSFNKYKGIGDKKGMAGSYNNIGIIHENTNNYDKSLEFYFKSLILKEDIGDKKGMADLYNNIGNIHKNKGDYDMAMEYYSKSLKINEENGDKQGMAAFYVNIGTLNKSLKKFTEARKYLERGLLQSKEIGSKEGMKLSCSGLSSLDSTLGNWKSAYEYHKLYSEIKDSIFNEESNKQITEMSTKYETEKKEQQIKLLNKDKEIQTKDLARQKTIRNAVAGGFVLVLLFSFILINRFVLIKKQKKVIETEREKSEKLLLNILPMETAEELKLTGKALPKYYEQVTVMFTDFKGFTQIAEKMSAEELVSELDFIFKKFDEIISKYPIEKIKTIGDSYMCAGGVPVANTTNPVDLVMAGLEICEWMRGRAGEGEKGGKGEGEKGGRGEKINLKEVEPENKQRGECESEICLPFSPSPFPLFQVRIGIHTGSVIAGVVGDKKFAYDIWGDTVNTASRMESSGKVGKVNISGTTYKLINTSEKLNMIYRGEIEAKNKGRIKMYFVERKL